MRTEDVHPRVTLIKSSNPHLAGGELALDKAAHANCPKTLLLHPLFFVGARYLLAGRT